LAWWCGEGGVQGDEREASGADGGSLRCSAQEKMAVVAKEAPFLKNTFDVVARGRTLRPDDGGLS